LQYKAALQPILFELLPVKFTLPQLQNLYEGVYNLTFDERNFRSKILSTALLIKQNKKDKINSRKGAFYFKLMKSSNRLKFHSLLNVIPNTHDIG
jgi:8-oxo-dGTP diphosphatase